MLLATALLQTRPALSTPRVGMYMHARWNPRGKTYDVWFKNNAKQTVTIRITAALLNETPFKEKLPLSAEVGLNESTTFSLQPLHPTVITYGEHAFIEYKTLVRGNVTAGGSFGTGVAIYPNASTALEFATFKPLRYDVWFGRPIDLPEMEFKDLRIQRKKVIIALKPGQWKLKKGERLNLASVPSISGKWTTTFKWRLTPWSPWHTQTQVLK